MSQSNDLGDDQNHEEDANNEFEFYFLFTKPLVLYLATEEDRAIAAAWVQKLEEEPQTEEERQLRLDYLKLLLFVLQRGRLSGIFRKQPPSGPLHPFPQGFNLLDLGNLIIDQEDIQGCGAGDARSIPYTIEISNDLREFVAAQEIPNFGVQMYYAWSSEEPVHKWSMFDEDKFPQYVLDKIKLLKEIKSDDKTAVTKGCNAKKLCDIPLVEKYTKSKVKSPQEIEKSQGRSYQTYAGFVRQMSAFKDSCTDDVEKYYKSDQKKGSRCQKKSGNKCGEGSEMGDEYENFLSGLGGNAKRSGRGCNFQSQNQMPDSNPQMSTPNYAQQGGSRSCSPKTRPDGSGPSWSNSVRPGMSVGNRGMNYGQGQYPESPMACGPDMGQRNSGSQTLVKVKIKEWKIPRHPDFHVVEENKTIKGECHQQPPRVKEFLQKDKAPQRVKDDCWCCDSDDVSEDRRRGKCNQFTQDVREDKEMETSICNRPPDYKPPSACLPRQTPNAFSSYAPQTPGQTPGKGRMKSDKQDCRRPQQPPPQQEDYCSEDTEDNYGLGTPSNTPRGPNGAVAVNFCNQSWRQGSNAMEPPKQMNYNQELDDRCNGSNRSYGDQFPERSFTSRTPYQGRDSKMNESYQGQQPAPAKMQMANTGAAPKQFRSGRPYNNVDNVFDGCKQKVEDHREKCDSFGRKSMNAEVNPCQRNGPPKPQQFSAPPQCQPMKPFQSPAPEGMMGPPYGQAKYGRNMSPQMNNNQSPMPCPPARRNTSPMYDNFSAQKGSLNQTGNMMGPYNNMNSAPSTNGNYVKGMMSYQNPSNMPKDDSYPEACPEEEYEECRSAPESGDDRPQDSSASECMETGEEPDPVEEVRSSPWLSNLESRPKSLKEKVEEQHRLMEMCQANAEKQKNNSCNPPPKQQCPPYPEQKNPQSDLDCPNYYPDANSPFMQMDDKYMGYNCPPQQQMENIFSNSDSMPTGCKRNQQRKQRIPQQQRFRDICDGKVEKGSMTLMKDISLANCGAKGEYLYNKVQDIVWDDVFSKYITCKEVCQTASVRLLLDCVECFTGPNISAMHSMLINKPPDSGALTSIHPLHQDLYYFPFRPVNKIVGVWTAMEKVTLENGCLIVMPGSHKGALLKHGYPDNQVNKAYHGIKNYNNPATVKLEMNKGDTVFFHPLLIHGSGPNLTKGFRKAISCHYSTSNFYFIDVKGTIQEDIANEIIDIAKRRGLDLTFQEIWNYRLRVVRGIVPSHL
ncbi:hypothetical protein RUM44_008266 [Polyplax serrata]|uniref:phytanoyl-CoA dioxygenase n=1 Tax=Polyplax serrata TaxID=468196 RepID=A0ABR1BBV3_POLSC